MRKLLNRLIDLGRRTGGNGVLFNGDDSMFKELVTQPCVYGEYGCGQSTLWVGLNTNNPIIAVDTSFEWVSRVRSLMPRQDGVFIEHVDLGEIGKWGRPLTYKHLDGFQGYVEGIWCGSLTPNLILIDGRFRVSCFLASLLRAPVGSKIIFDDYRDRLHYHIVERIIKPSIMCGRQAIFEVPEKGSIDREEAAQIQKNFLVVFD
jgi:hypothetical protein